MQANISRSQVIPSIAFSAMRFCCLCEAEQAGELVQLSIAPVLTLAPVEVVDNDAFSLGPACSGSSSVGGAQPEGAAHGPDRKDMSTSFDAVHGHSIGAPHPLLTHVPRFDGCIRLVRAEALLEMQAPIPRCQDVFAS